VRFGAPPDFSGLESSLARPGDELSAKKKHQHENGDNFCIRTLLSMNLGLLESSQQVLQLDP
jgi:hypothetical protein